jgi:Ca2+-binding EF-hand superfamily protein
MEVVENLWKEYDADGSGFLDRAEMIPLAQAALAQIGFNQTLDPAVIDAFFVEIDSDGNGMIDKSELQRFMKSLL